MTTYPADYLRDAIADEMAIAGLLGYHGIACPQELNSNSTLFGHLGRTFASYTGTRTVSEPKVWLPKWRRTWDGAGELIARCQLSVVQRVSGTAIDHVTVSAPFCEPAYAAFLDHPTPDDAIRSAMCKAAIAYLQAESSTTKESK